jgi:hypothetical protein
VISYRAGNELRLARCTTADCAGAAMITPLASGLSDAEKQKPTSIAMGADGFPLVLYAGTIGTAITLVDCGDADCLARTSVPIDTVASSAELTLKLDAAGLPAIAYPDLGASSFTIARCTEQDCSGTIHYCRLSASEPIGRYSDMDVGSDGFPIAVYDSSTGPGILRCTDRVFLDGFEGT